MSNRIRSGFSKGLFVFLVVILVSTGGLIWPLWLLDMGIGFQVIGTIFLVPFFLFSLYLILDALFHYEVVEGDEIKEIRFFSKKVAKMKDISGIDAPPGYYVIYVKEKKFCTLNAQDAATSAMLFQFSKNGFDLSKIRKTSK